MKTTFERPPLRIARHLVVAVALSLLDGNGAVLAQEKHRVAERMLQHPNGLRLALPAGYRAAQTPQGFIVEPAGGQATRSGVFIQAAWFPTAPPAHPLRRAVAPGRVLRYSVRQTADAVGSGGAEYTLSACEAVAVGSVCLWQTKQGEHGAPLFELWDIAPGATFEAPPAPAR